VHGREENLAAAPCQYKPPLPGPGAAIFGFADALSALSVAVMAEGSSGMGAATVALAAVAGTVLSGGFGGAATSIAGPIGGSAAVVAGGSGAAAGGSGFGGTAAMVGSAAGRSGGDGSAVAVGKAAVAGSGNGRAVIAGLAGFSGNDTGITTGFSGVGMGEAAGAATVVGATTWAGSLGLK
jgi:hypothetical protein